VRPDWKFWPKCIAWHVLFQDLVYPHSIGPLHLREKLLTPQLAPLTQVSCKMQMSIYSAISKINSGVPLGPSPFKLAPKTQLSSEPPSRTPLLDHSGPSNIQCPPIALPTPIKVTYKEVREIRSRIGMPKTSRDILTALRERYVFIIDDYMKKMANVVSFYHLCFQSDIGDFTA